MASSMCLSSNSCLSACDGWVDSHVGGSSCCVPMSIAPQNALASLTSKQAWECMCSVNELHLNYLVKSYQYLLQRQLTMFTAGAIIYNKQNKINKQSQIKRSINSSHHFRYYGVCTFAAKRSPTVSASISKVLERGSSMQILTTLFVNQWVMAAMPSLGRKAQMMAKGTKINKSRRYP